MISLALVLAFLASPTASAQGADAKISAEWHFATDGVHPGEVIHAALQIRLENGFHVQSNKPLDEFAVATALQLKLPAGTTVLEIVYPKAHKFEVAGEPYEVFDPEFVIGVALQTDGDVKPGEHAINATLEYQACNDKICLNPDSLEVATKFKVVAANVSIANTNNKVFETIAFSESPAPIEIVTPATQPKIVPTVAPDCDVVAALNDFTILGTSGGYQGVDEFISFIDDAEIGVVKKNVFEDKGPLVIAVLIIIGGVLLNLTPCVLPLIPINLAILGAGSQAGSRTRGFLLGGTYGLAMAIVYGALGLIVVLTASTFGTINSTVWFNVAIALLFIVLALGMFDVVAIDFTKYQTNLDATKVAASGTIALAFFMGCVTALLAGACVAPVVIQVIVYSGDQYAKGASWALSLPFLLGLGMALPWPFAGAGLALLPKPGKWMVWVKKGMGVFILAFAVYYGYLAWEIWDSKRVDRGAVESAVAEQLEGGWTANICQGLAQAKAENKPVLIDMWATWCKNCYVMDRTTLKDLKVLGRLDGYIKIKFQAEDLDASPAREMLERFDGIGLPTYAILKPKAAASP